MTRAPSRPVPRTASRPDALPDVAHPRPFLLDLTVTPGDAGEVVGHVDNVRYLRWLDRSAELHSDSAGYPRQRLLDDGVMWFVARHEIDYIAEAHPGDRLVVATWVRNMRRVKSWRDSVIVRPADGATVCRAATLWVLVDLGTRRPIRIPNDMAERFEPMENL